MQVSKNIIRDSVNLDVYIPDFAFSIIDSKEFQRLRRIKQLGGAFLVYPGANHTRFQHSIGVMHNLYLIKTQNNTHKFSEVKWKEILAAGLLHDIGHGPLSHTFETISNGNLCHEEIGIKIILDKKSEVYKALKKHKINPNHVVALLKGENKIVKELLSSHIDVDRMDYLIRDAYHTGTNYGIIDKNKLIKSMDLSGDKITFKPSAEIAIESFLFARYQAFKSIYLHRIGVIHEQMLLTLFNKLKENKNSKEYHKIYQQISVIWDKEIDLDKYLDLDDEMLMSILIKLSKSSDKVIRDFSKRLRDRDLFEAWSENIKLSDTTVISRLKKKGYDPKYYFIKKKIKKDTFVTFKKQPIWLKYKNGKEVDIVKTSPLIAKLATHKHFQEFIILPKGII